MRPEASKAPILHTHDDSGAGWENRHLRGFQRTIRVSIDVSAGVLALSSILYSQILSSIKYAPSALVLKFWIKK